MVTLALCRFITLFSSILPMKIFLRVIDIFWFEQLKTIFRAALTIIKIRKDEILNVSYRLRPR